VHDGHQQRLEPGHGSALPRFSDHEITVLPGHLKVALDHCAT